MIHKEKKNGYVIKYLSGISDEINLRGIQIRLVKMMFNGKDQKVVRVSYIPKLKRTRA